MPTATPQNPSQSVFIARNWRDLIRPRKLEVEPETLTPTYGKLSCEPLERGFGTTIGHGYLTLSLIPYLSQRSFAIKQPFRMAINYGSNRVRFTSPVPVGSRIRNRILVAVDGENDESRRGARLCREGGDQGS